MTRTDETDGRVHATATPLEGDDITILPGNVSRPRRRRRPALALTAAGVLLAAIVAAAALRHPASGRVRTSAPPVSTVAAAKTAPRARPAPTTVAQASRPSAAPPSSAAVIHSTTAPTHAPLPVTSPRPIVTPMPGGTVAAPRVVPSSALHWDAPDTVTVKSGASVAFSVRAVNPTDGIVELPNPLSCAPSLDNSTVCAAVVQIIGPGQAAAARYTISAGGVRPGTYVLSIEGLRTVRVSVTA